MMFPKPKDAKKTLKPAVKVFAGGREVCDQLTKAGRDEYRRRTLEMWERQGSRCALQITDICKQRQGRWTKDEVQFDHAAGRGGGKQDDRIEVLDPETGKMKWQNASVCAWCNSVKGSRRIPYIVDCP